MLSLKQLLEEKKKMLPGLLLALLLGAGGAITDIIRWGNT